MHEFRRECVRYRQQVLNIQLFGAAEQQILASQDCFPNSLGLDEKRHVRWYKSVVQESRPTLELTEDVVADTGSLRSGLRRDKYFLLMKKRYKYQYVKGGL